MGHWGPGEQREARCAPGGQGGEVVQCEAGAPGIEGERGLCRLRACVALLRRPGVARDEAGRLASGGCQVWKRRILTPMALARRVRSAGSLVTTAA
jgi:hypothetical protein